MLGVHRVARLWFRLVPLLCILFRQDSFAVLFVGALLGSASVWVKLGQDTGHVVTAGAVAAGVWGQAGVEQLVKDKICNFSDIRTKEK